MALNIKEIPQQGGWFKPADHKTSVAIVVEITTLDRQKPTPHGPKDSALCDVTVFDTDAELDAGKPTHELKGLRIEQSLLARDLFALDRGDTTILTLAQLPPKNGNQPAWVWRTVSRGVQQKAVKYLTDREQAIEAALADVPSFD